LDITPPLSGHSTVVAVKQQVSSDLDDEAVILHLKAGVYYGLDSVGARIWALIQEPKTVDEIKDAILNEYDVEPDQCERDVLALLQELAAEDLIEVTTETQSG
jgi:Coenzyme PQQ synthesis protein D (PqqD)